MSRPLDYSKWDNIHDSDDENDDENDGNGYEEDRNRPPQVTRFDAPMSVTFGGKPESSSEADEVVVMPSKQGE